VAWLVHSSHRLLLGLYARLWLYAVVFEGWSLDLRSQIQSSAVSLRRAAICWWRVDLHARRADPHISPNKACAGSSDLGCQAQIDVEALLLATVLSWWKPKVVKMVSNDSFFNKVWFLIFCCCDFYLFLPPLARGGSSEFDGRSAFMVWWLEFVGNLGSGDGGAVSSPSTHLGGAGKEVIVRHGQILDCPGVVMPISEIHTRSHCWQPTLLTIWWSCLLAMASTSSTSIRRPYYKLAVALSFPAGPSGCVPGFAAEGHGWSLLFVVGGGGSDCSFQILYRVLFVKYKDYVVIFFPSRVLVVICTPTAGN